MKVRDSPMVALKEERLPVGSVMPAVDSDPLDSGFQ